ncbi:MAG: hypothetical protein RR412_06120 [Burkholderiaceae bacterium]
MPHRKPREAPLWRKPDGTPVACVEKIKVLNDNYRELRELAQDALEDAVLMGCAEDQVRLALHLLVDELVNPYHESDPPQG